MVLTSFVKSITDITINNSLLEVIIFIVPSILLLALIIQLCFIIGECINIKYNKGFIPKLLSLYGVRVLIYVLLLNSIFFRSCVFTHYTALFIIVNLWIVFDLLQINIVVNKIFKFIIQLNTAKTIFDSITKRMIYIAEKTEEIRKYYDCFVFRLWSIFIYSIMGLYYFIIVYSMYFYKYEMSSFEQTILTYTVIIMLIKIYTRKIMLRENQ
jgi:hypothetical protein